MKGALYTLNLNFQDNFINQMLLYCCDEAASQRLLVPVSLCAAGFGEDPEAEVRAPAQCTTSQPSLWDLLFALCHLKFSAAKSENNICPASCREQGKANDVIGFANTVF